MVPTGLHRDNLRGPYFLHDNGFRGTANRTYPAPHAPFSIDPGFGFIPLHPDGVEHAPFQAGLAADALILVDRGLKAAGVEEFMGVGKTLEDAAVPATIADDVIDFLPVVNDMD